VKRGMEELTKVSHKLAEEIYKKTQTKNQAGAAGPGQEEGPQAGPGAEPQGEEAASGKKDDVIDAEFTEGDEGGKGRKR